MDSIFKGTALTALDLDQYPQASLKNKMGTFDEVDIHKSYAHTKLKDEETVTITIILRHIGRKI